MPRLTLRTLLAYIDDTLGPAETRSLGAKVGESESARELIDRIKRVTRRRALATPTPESDDDNVSDPNTVAEYLSDTLESEQVKRLEETCLTSDVHLAEVAACHQILTVVLTEPVRVPPQANQRMYKLVGPPGSQPNRRPGKALPVGGAVPTGTDGDHDDADAALLLGMHRYSSAPRSSRLVLGGTVLVLVGFLALAVAMALPHKPPAPPASRPGLLAAVAPESLPERPAPPPTKQPEKDKPPPKNDTPTPTRPPEKPPTPPVKPPDMNVTPPGPKVPGPRADRGPIGKIESQNVAQKKLVLTRADDSPTWLALDPIDNPGILSRDQVLCLPGYKADVRLEGGLRVHLWGNVPEELPAELLEVRARFYQPAEKFDADLTLLAGRVYFDTRKPDGARIRVRFADETWDITLADDKTDVMIEVITRFIPGTPYSRERGLPPDSFARLAVIRGKASVTAPARPATFPNLTASTMIRWDSIRGQIAPPEPFPPTDPYYKRFFGAGLKGEYGMFVAAALANIAGSLTGRDGVRLVLKERLTQPPEKPDRATIVSTRLAVYAQAAISDTAEDLLPLLNILDSLTRSYARAPVAMALNGWVARDPGNTAALFGLLTERLKLAATDADLVLRLIRGYANPVKPDPADLDRLVSLLNHPLLEVRELALYNLVTFVDPEAAANPQLNRDVGAKDSPVATDTDAYAAMIRRWQIRVDEIKKGPPPPKKEKDGKM